MSDDVELTGEEALHLMRCIDIGRVLGPMTPSLNIPKDDRVKILKKLNYIYERSYVTNTYKEIIGE